MTVIDSISELLGDELKDTFKSNSMLQFAKAGFSINAYSRLNAIGELSEISSLLSALRLQKQ